MTTKALQALQTNVAHARQRLAEAIDRGAVASEIEDLGTRVEWLEGMLRRARRRQSVVWIIVAVAVAILAAVVLEGIHSSRTKVTLAAETGAFTFVNGASRRTLNPTPIVATEVSDFCSDGSGCALTALIANPKSAGTLQASGSCFELTVLEGVIEAELVATTPFAHDSRRLEKGSTLRVCPESEPSIQLDGLASVIVGDTTGIKIEERKTFPALLFGTLFLEDTKKSIELRRTDVPRIGGLQSDGVLVARLGDPIELSMYGTASAITLDSRSGSTSMPTWLDWIRSSSTVQSAFAIVAAIVAAAFAVRERFLSEV